MGIRFDILLPELHLPGLFTLRSPGPHLGLFHLLPDLDLAGPQGASHQPSVAATPVDQRPHPWHGEDRRTHGRRVADCGARGVSQLRHAFLRREGWGMGWGGSGHPRGGEHFWVETCGFWTVFGDAPC